MITFYSTHCPRCKNLEQKLKKKGIQYIEVNDIEEMQRLGFTSAPVLEVDGKIMNFGDAYRWVMNYEGE